MLMTEREKDVLDSLLTDEDSPNDIRREMERHKYTGIGQISSAVLEIISAIGEDKDREGLLATPERVARMYLDLTSGYKADLDVILNGAIFEADYDEMVIVQDIDFYSLCEHHLIPFHGFAHVGYIPKEGGRVIGLSKIPRLVEVYAKRLQLQERMTCQIAQVLDYLLHPLGVAVVIEAHHLCCGMRGVKKSNVRMTTSSMIGCFKEDLDCRSEFLSLIGK